MAGLLPELIDNAPIDTQINFQNYPTYTYYVDPQSKQILTMADGITAMTQAVEIILSVERYAYSIHSPNFGVEFRGLIGNDYGFVVSDFRRRVLEAFSVDDRILGISKYVADPQVDNYVTIYMTVNTVFGDYTTQTTLEVM